VWIFTLGPVARNYAINAKARGTGIPFPPRMILKKEKYFEYVSHIFYPSNNRNRGVDKMHERYLGNRCSNLEVTGD